MKVVWRGTGIDTAVKDQGMTYYRHNQIHLETADLTNMGHLHFEATVNDIRDYHVTAEVDGYGKISGLSCTCSDAREGKSCRHMAALLHHISYWNVPKDVYQSLLRKQQTEEAIIKAKKINEEVSAQKEMERQEEAFYASRKPIRPFTEPDDASYRYFNFAEMTDKYLIFDRDYEKAQSLARDNVDAASIHYRHLIDKPSESLICQLDNKYLSEIYVRRGEIFLKRCKMPYCRCNRTGAFTTPLGKEALCPGALAGLIQMRNWIEENPNRGDATSTNADRMLQAFRKKVNQEKSTVLNASREVHLEPTLVNERGQFSLTWRIGFEKLFIVKDLVILVEAVKERKTYALGKKDQIQFGQDIFDERGEKYYRLIEDGVQEAERILRQFVGRLYSYGSPQETKNAQPLYGEWIDRFFDAAPEHGLQYIRNRGFGKREFLLRKTETNAEPKLTLNQIIDSNGVFHGVLLHGEMPELIEGGKYQYTITDDDVYAYLARVSPESAERMLPFSQFAKNGKLELSIGRKNLSEFYYTVLPEIKKLADVEEPDDDQIRPFLPPPAEFAIYLDAENKVPVCRVTVTYGEETCSLLDWRMTGFVPQPFRSAAMEQEARNLIFKYFTNIDEKKDQYRCTDSSEAILRLLDYGLEEMTAFCPVHSTRAFDALRIRRPPTIQIGVSISDGSLLELHMTSDDLSPEDLMEMLESYRQKKVYHRLRDGGWVKLDKDIEELNQLFEALFLSPKNVVEGKMHIPSYRALYLDRMLQEMDHFYTSRDQRFRKMIKEFKTIDDSDIEPPVSLEKVLRPYQVYGYKWMRTLAEYGFGGILADDMGLGKTLQMISVFLSAKEAGEKDPSLVICPASLVYNWQEEILRFAPALKTCVIAGTKAERSLMLEHADEFDVLITSYDLLKRDIVLYSDLQFNYQVIDEAQFIKTQTTVASKSVRLVHARHRFALTGTPIENRLSELWSIFDFLMPGYLYHYENFKRQIETPIVRTQDREASARLQKMISPFVLRRLKRDVLKDLPDKLEEVRYVRLEGEQQRLYDAQTAKIRSMLSKSTDEDMNRKKFEILAQLTRIRQICCDPSLVFEDFNAVSAKREACLDLIRSAMDGYHRILVFSQFTSMLALLETDLNDAGIEYYIITGDTPKQERVDLVRKFNEGETPVFLISLKAGGTGLNLTGADTVVHYDPWWNVAAQNQATDRAHRIGQLRTVCVYKLIGKDTIEEKILKLQQDKQDLAEEILSGENRSISSMTREELMALLG